MEQRDLEMGPSNYQKYDSREDYLDEILKQRRQIYQLKELLGRSRLLGGDLYLIGDDNAWREVQQGILAGQSLEQDPLSREIDQFILGGG